MLCLGFCSIYSLSKKIGAIGFDYSYYDDTPFNETQTYLELSKLCKPSEIDKFFIFSKSVDGRKFFQDPTFIGTVIISSHCYQIHQGRCIIYPMPVFYMAIIS